MLHLFVGHFLAAKKVGIGIPISFFLPVFLVINLGYDLQYLYFQYVYMYIYIGLYRSLVMNFHLIHSNGHPV